MTYLQFCLLKRPVLLRFAFAYISVMPLQTTHSVICLSCYGWGPGFCNSMHILKHIEMVLFFLLKLLLIAQIHTIHQNIKLMFQLKHVFMTQCPKSVNFSVLSWDCTKDQRLNRILNKVQRQSILQKCMHTLIICKHLKTKVQNV